ncbi:MAG TPA: hypothetical protein VEU97_14860 [Ktedonobacteraceae bacterium]|nr:hypothetical protein [Ktedonobacteraceae bacterium]
MLLIPEASMLEATMRKPERVVPLEPWLKSWRYQLIFSPIMLVLGIGILFLPSEFHYGFLLNPSANFPFLISFGLSPLISYAFHVKQWKYFEKRRQQAAMLNFETRPYATAYPFPDVFTPQLPINIRMRRDWPGIWTWCILYALFLVILFAMMHYEWQRDLTIITQQKLPLDEVYLGVGIDVAYVISIGIFMAQSLFYSSRQQLIATEGGLICHLGTRFSYIPWQEARLFAAIGGSGEKRDAPPRFYELASATEVIRWSTLPYASFGAPYQTMGITHFGQAQAYPSDEEYCRQMLTLLSFIAAQTRLPLHDLR